MTHEYTEFVKNQILKIDNSNLPIGNKKYIISAIQNIEKKYIDSQIKGTELIDTILKIVENYI